MPTEVIMPQMGESLVEGTVTKWLKRVGERVELDEPLFEISTDKVDAEIPSPASGILVNILVNENQTASVNAVVAVIDEIDVSPAQKEPAESIGAIPPIGPILRSEPQTEDSRATPPQEPSRSGPAPRPLSSPFVRRIAREHQIDLSTVRGSGTGGRVRKEDTARHIQHDVASAAATTSDGLSDHELQQTFQPAFSGPVAVVPMTAMRRQIADHMLGSRRISAHVTTVFEVDMTEVVAAREGAVAECHRRHGFKLNYTAFFVRAAALVVKEFPVFNASVDGTNIVYKREVNIGVAVAMSTGLIVPVIRRADEKNVLGIARAVNDLADRARSKRLRVEDVKDGTFTVTNPGVFGSLFGSPIINQPQVAILAVGVIQQRAVVRNNAFAIRSMAYLSLSYDHRIIDGALGAQFLGRLKAVLEKWTEPVL